MINHGLVLDTPVPKKDYVFGSALRLEGQVLVPDGQWDLYLPPDEYQNLNGIEPYACASFGTLNCVETLERREYGATANYSDRFLAKITGTDLIKGNSPQVVAETLRKRGAPPEANWPFDSTIDTFDKFYQEIPNNIYSAAITFNAEFNFGHEYVPSDPNSMMTALKYSPLGVDVFAWQPDGHGLYERGGVSNHWVMCYGFEEGIAWHVFDSYDYSHKKLEWNYGFSMVKRYTLNRQVISETWWQTFLRQLWVILGLVPSTDNGMLEVAIEAPVSPKTAPQPMQHDESMNTALERFCSAIEVFEGANLTNNNPGNCRCSPVGYAPKYGAVKCNKNGFAVFPNYSLGLEYLHNLVLHRVTLHTDWTFYDFFSNYAPSTDGNNPHHYAEWVATRCNVSPTMKLSTFLT